VFSGEKQVADYYCALINVLSEPAVRRKDMVLEFASSIPNFDFTDLDALPPNKTLIVPTLQMGFYGLRQDEAYLEQILRNVCGEVWISTPYLNFTRRMRALLLASRTDSLNIVTASPAANGFYNSKGKRFFISYLKVFREMSREAIHISQPSYYPTFHPLNISSMLDPLGRST
jgi:hypothetical protein